MARTAYVLSKLNKAGFEVTGPEGPSARYWATLAGANTTLRFYGKNGTADDAHNFYVKRDDAEDDIMTDYWAGSFSDNIVQAIGRIVDARDRNVAIAEAHADDTCGHECSIHREAHAAGTCIGHCVWCGEAAKRIARVIEIAAEHPNHPHYALGVVNTSCPTCSQEYAARRDGSIASA